MITDYQDVKLRNRRTLLLFSGGFDSTFVALTLLDASAEITVLSLDYPQRPKAEIESAESTLNSLGISRRIAARVDLQDFRNSPDKWLSARHEAWIPYRNIVFFGMAAHYAYLTNCNLIAAGIRVWDTTAYNDSTIDFFQSVEALLPFSGGALANETIPLEFYLPIIRSHDPIRKFVEANPATLELLERTWSCWRNADDPCGLCAPCTTRATFLSGLKKFE